jgi:hypothetical protein
VGTALFIQYQFPSSLSSPSQVTSPETFQQLFKLFAPNPRFTNNIQSTTTMSDNIKQLSLPKYEFPIFKVKDWRTWQHMAKVFFIQHDLYRIVDGSEENPAGADVLPKTFDGKIRQADGSILEGEPDATWGAPQRKLWDWNRRHGIAYGFILKSLTEERNAYSKITGCKTAHDVWDTLAKQYGSSSNVILRVLESQLSELHKRDDTTMAEHIDRYCQLTDEINYHLKDSEKWSVERMNRTLFSTLSHKQWGAYEDGLGKEIETILPSELILPFTKSSSAA